MPEVTDHALPGLQQPAEIVVDRWGIPHLRAATRHDLFFVQGFNAGRDRLWQLDTWRRRGLGLLAAAYGPGFLAQDRAARLFLYRGDMAAEYAAYGIADAEAVLRAFTDGINAWIALALRRPELLAREFAAAGVQPERFAPADVLRIRAIAPMRNLLSEVARAQVTARAGHRTDLARRALEPDHVPVPAEGLDPGSIPAEVLEVYRLGTAPFDASPGRLAAPLEDAWHWTRVTDAGEVAAEGSNNWAIAPARTDTGRAILAGDPHRVHALPSLRYIVHLTGAGIDAIGAGEPATPGLHIGHNARAAFGLTIFPVDQEDLYVYETHPDDPELYRYGEGWERMRRVTEGVAVKGEAEQEVVLRFTRHGPVLHEDPAARRAYALRTVWTEPGAAPYMRSLAYLDAASPADYARTLAGWVAPSTNHVYADIDGNIAWFTAGAVPRREGWDGLLPVPGDGGYEWRGFLAAAELPRAVNPAKGFVATANEMNLPDAWVWQDHPPGFEWAEHSRSTRIREVLRAQPRHGLANSLALQTDVLSVPARRLTALLHGLAAEGEAATARAMLLGWDCRLTAASGAAALHEVWWTLHLRPALLDRIAGGDAVLRTLLAPGDVETLLALLERPGEDLPGRDALLAATLEAAFADCRERLGAPAVWAWGRLHQGDFPHPLGRVFPDLPGVGPLPKGGSGSTVMCAACRPPDFRVATGASFRMVVDVGAWDNSRCINAPGQSGNPASPHYGDLAPLWAAGEYVPMLFSPTAIDAAAALVIRLRPG